MIGLSLTNLLRCDAGSPVERTEISITNCARIRLRPQVWQPIPHAGGRSASFVLRSRRKLPMKIWNKPQVREQEVGLEVTSYMPAEIDII